MFVIKRNGEKQKVAFDKITARITRLCYGLHPSLCDPVSVAQKVAAGVYSGVKTAELDELTAETAASLTSKHPDYAILAARVAVSNLHKNTHKSFAATIKTLYDNVYPRTGAHSPLIADDVYDIVMANAQRLDQEIRYDRDFEYDFFGFKTLERSYLLRINNKVMERPQHMIMRCAIGIHKDDIEGAVETYHLMSDRWFTHASPTLFNAGTPRPALSSCFLLTMKNDSIEGIFDTLKECATISKNAGGIGLSVHNIRASGSLISGTNGVSNGLVPMLRVFNDTARYVDQCFAPDTTVYTAKGPVAISSVHVGEFLLTATGALQPVERVLEHSYSGKLLAFTVAGKRIRVTGLHQVLTVPLTSVACSSEQSSREEATIETLKAKPVIHREMVEASPAECGRCCVFPKSLLGLRGVSPR